MWYELTVDFETCDKFLYPKVSLLKVHVIRQKHTVYATRAMIIGQYWCYKRHLRLDYHEKGGLGLYKLDKNLQNEPG